MKRIIILTLALIFLLFGCSSTSNSTDEDLCANCELTTQKDYRFVDDTTRLKKISFEETFNILDNGTGLIYFGYPACEVCQRAVPVLLELANDKDINIYYNEMHTAEETKDDIDRLFERTEFFLWMDNEGNRSLGFPMVVCVKEGMIRLVTIGLEGGRFEKDQPLSKEDAKNLYDSYDRLYYYMINWQ